MVEGGLAASAAVEAARPGQSGGRPGEGGMGRQTPWAGEQMRGGRSCANATRKMNGGAHDSNHTIMV